MNWLRTDVLLSLLLNHYMSFYIWSKPKNQAIFIVFQWYTFEVSSILFLLMFLYVVQA